MKAVAVRRRTTFSARARRSSVAWATVSIALMTATTCNSGPRAIAPAPPVDPHAAEPAYRRGVDLAESGRCRESLLEFRLAVESRPDMWIYHFAYGSAMFSTAHEARSHLRRQEFVVRSSVERVTLIRDGLAELETAARLTRDQRAQAHIHRTRAQILKAWGLGWNAFESYRASEWSDTTWKESGFITDAFMRLMENPTRAGD